MNIFINYSFRKMRQHILLIISVILLVFLSSLSISLLISNNEVIQTNYDKYRNTAKSGPGYDAVWDLNSLFGFNSLTSEGVDKTLETVNSMFETHVYKIDENNENKPLRFNNYQGVNPPPPPVGYQEVPMSDFIKYGNVNEKLNWTRHLDLYSRMSPTVKGLDWLGWATQCPQKDDKGHDDPNACYVIRTHYKDNENRTRAWYGGFDSSILIHNIFSKYASKYPHLKLSLRPTYSIKIRSMGGFVHIIPIINSQKTYFNAYHQHSDQFVLDKGKLPSNPNEFAVTSRIMDDNNWKLGQTFLFESPNIKQPVQLKLVGIGNTDYNIVNSNSDQIKLFMDSDSFFNSEKSIFNDNAASFMRTNQLRMRLFMVGSDHDINGFVNSSSSDFEKIFQNGDTVKAKLQMLNSTFLYYFKMTLTAFNTLSIWLSVLIIVIDSIVILAVMQTLFRRWKYDLGMLKAMGYDRKKLLLLLLVGIITFSTIAFFAGFWCNLILQHFLFSHIWTTLVTFSIPDTYISWPTFGIVAIAAPIILFIISTCYALFSFRASALKLIFGDKSLHAKNIFTQRVYVFFVKTIKYVFLYPIRGPMSKFKLSFYLTQIVRSLFAMIILVITAALFTFPLLIVTVSNSTNTYSNGLLKYSEKDLNITPISGAYEQQMSSNISNLSRNVWVDFNNNSQKNQTKSLDINTLYNIIVSESNSQNDDPSKPTDQKIYEKLSTNNYYLSSQTIAKVYTQTDPKSELVHNYLTSTNLSNFFNSETPRGIAFGFQPYSPAILSPIGLTSPTQTIVGLSGKSTSNFDSQVIQMGSYYENYFDLGLTQDTKKAFLGNPWVSQDKKTTAVKVVISNTLLLRYKVKLNTTSPQFAINFSQMINDKEVDFSIPIMPIAIVPRALNSSRIFLSSAQLSKAIFAKYHFPFNAENLTAGLSLFPKISEIEKDYVGLFYSSTDKSYQYKTILGQDQPLKHYFKIKSLSLNFPGFTETATVLSAIILIITFVIVISFVATILSDNQRIITILKITGYRISEIVSIVVTYYAVTLLIALAGGVGVAYALLGYFSNLLLKLAGYEFYTGLISTMLITVIAILAAIFMGVFIISFIMAHRVKLTLSYSE